MNPKRNSIDSKFGFTTLRTIYSAVGGGGKVQAICSAWQATWTRTRAVGWTVALPHIGAEFTGGRRHPSAGVVDALADLPPWNVFHDPGLLFQVLLPLFDEPTGCTQQDWYKNGVRPSGIKLEIWGSHLSSSSAWSMGSIALRAAYFSSLIALHIHKQNGMIGLCFRKDCLLLKVWFCNFCC